MFYIPPAFTATEEIVLSTEEITTAATDEIVTATE